ncbi:Flp pilus assembly protein CpaB, partial [Burkholderia thailandensis]|nr:Flp pilus assembly protein CpaB [Burkholderia thailandensis]
FRDATRAPAAAPAAGARLPRQNNPVVIYRGSTVDDGARGGGIGVAGVPPLPSGLPGLPGVSNGASNGGNLAAQAPQPPGTATQ